MQIIKIIGFVFLLGLVSCTNSNTPENVVKEFYEAVKAEDYDKARTFASKDSKKFMTMMSKGMELSIGGTELSNVDCTTDGESSDCDCFFEGQEKPFPVSVIKEDGNWKVDFKGSAMNMLDGLMDGFKDLDIDLNGLMDNFKDVDLNGLLDVGQKLIQNNSEAINELIKSTNTDSIVESLNAMDTSLNLTKDNVNEFIEKIQKGLEEVKSKN